ncbi:MAG: SH3 domain-containing protein [Butyrivibrio sp.]|nr:SH3 domain-containing protein [Butyrivibrio sp.]
MRKQMTILAGSVSILLLLVICVVTGRLQAEPSALVSSAADTENGVRWVPIEAADTTEDAAIAEKAKAPVTLMAVRGPGEMPPETSMDAALAAGEQKEVVPEEMPVSEDTAPEPVVFHVTAYDTEETLYANTRVNIRSGADTSYERIATVPAGTPITVSGETDTGWYEVRYGEQPGYMKQEYLQRVRPGTPLVLSGDSRTVQMSMAVKKSQHAWIAQVGEGYGWFSETAIPLVEDELGEGTVLVLNFGVNDLNNASKYIRRINDKIDSWLAKGAQVYYASVGPVGESASVTNEQIEKFNATMQAGLDSRIGWIDEYGFLSQNGFSSNDGLHYDFDTYRTLYSYYLSQIGR